MIGTMKKLKSWAKEYWRGGDSGGRDCFGYGGQENPSRGHDA